VISFANCSEEIIKKDLDENGEKQVNCKGPNWI
jgi:hypothetical protein